MGGKIGYFWPITRHISNNGARQGQGHYGSAIESHVNAFDCHQIRRPWMTLNGRRTKATPYHDATASHHYA